MSILQQLYKDTTETKQTVENINETLGSLYSIQKKEAKAEEKERQDKEKRHRREERMKKRSFFDKMKAEKEKEEKEKKEKKNWLSSLMDMIKGLAGSLLSGLGPILTGALAPIMATVGGIIMGALPAIATAVGVALKAGAVILAGILATKAGSKAVDNTQAKSHGLANVGTEEQPVYVHADDAVRVFDTKKFRDKLTPEQLEGGSEFLKLMRQRKDNNDKLFNVRAEKKTHAEKIKETEAAMVALRNKAKKGSLTPAEKRDLARLQNQRREQNTRMMKLLEWEKKHKDAKEKADKDLKKLIKKLDIDPKLFIQASIDAGRRSVKTLPKGYHEKDFDANAVGATIGSLFDYGDQEQKQSGGMVQFLQNGGPAFTVPGHGNGDQVPMMLPQGSFVLNRNASQFLQDGGPAVPTLLEPGEKVFMPGSWENNGIADLNNTIGRHGPTSFLQGGGHVAKAVAHIKKDEALSSLSPGPYPNGESDWIKPGGFSVKSRTPWGDVHGDTKLYAYNDNVPVPTIGWGNTYYDNIRNGKKKVKIGDVITKKKADQIMNTNVSALANDYSKEIPHWGKMSDSQKAGLISMGYNAPNFFTSNTFAPKLKGALKRGDMKSASANLSWGGPSPTRIKESQQMLLKGPMDLSKVRVPHKVTGKTNATMPSNPPGQFQKRQSGGMVNTLLEPGEKVFMPGTWENNGIAELNKMAPRKGPGSLKLQTGGLVKANHPDTGEGWSVGKDSYGRPAVFSKPAAQAFLEAMKASKGVVKTSDITSSTRSPAKNASLPGAAKNSNHLYGNAVDIHGASKAWLKENGMNHGWKNLVYSGHDGHFDFKGGGQLQPANGDGKEKTAEGDTSPASADPSGDGNKGKSGDSLGLGSLFGNAKTYLGTLLGGIGDITGMKFIGDLAEGLGGQHRNAALGGNHTPIKPNISKSDMENETSRLAKQQQAANQTRAASAKPIIVKAGGAQSGPKGSIKVEGSAHTDIPNLPDGPSSAAQADYFYNLPLGGVS